MVFQGFLEVFLRFSMVFYGFKIFFSRDWGCFSRVFLGIFQSLGIQIPSKKVPLSF